ncbi:hypothetical protein HANVADRAFT_53170 [Hanseniaspora valbyensis NRRL Y-1626]|uniref:Uncharacterized protein n=1 Tax=Hanseniaspora valbyensis NRRL Y-1626 TaxID=766949 RepID=A0A1B7TCG2_9ASCO|nr:hypothetical protein HANVADRAFT_53170 [Hanseniaspora valbyensis NRRL Y-1626]
MSDKIENSNFSGNPSVMMRKGHKHKRSFALSGENFEFLQPNSNNNTIIGKTQRSNSNGSLPEFLDISRADKNDSSKQNSFSNNVVIDFDDAEKFMLSKNNKPASLRHKRSESAPSELNFDKTISTNNKQLSYDNWLDVANTTMEDHINNSWENDYKTEDDFQNNNNNNSNNNKGNVFFKNSSVLQGSSTELLIEEDENESSSENGSPIKQRQLDPTANVTLSTPATTINTTGKYKVSSRNFSDSSYRSITPSSATSGTGNSYRSIAKPQRERYYNFGIPYSPQGSRNSSNGSHKSNNNSSVNSGGSLSASTPTSNNPTINSSNSNNTNSSNLPLKKSAPSMRLNGYVSGSSNSAKYSPRMSCMSNNNINSNNNSTKSPFNFKPQEYDISKDLEELKDLNDEENNNNNNSSNDHFDNNVDRNNTENTFVENKKESISTISNSNYPSNSTNINNTNRSSQTPKHSSYNNSISRHSRQLTDTDSNLTLLISTTNNNSNTNKQANISETSFVDGISVIEEPENENSVLIGVGSVSSGKENDYVLNQLPTSPPLFHNDYKEPSKTCTNTNNTQKTNITINAKPNRKKLSIPSSISMSNLSIKSFSTGGGDKKRENNNGSERSSSSSGLKKSLSIQSLSKYLNKRSDSKPSSEDKPVDSKRRGSFMSRLFTRKG